jgi:uncharacterized membrane protein YcaP (DUF421 family)
VVLIENGEIRIEALKEARIGIDEILVAARDKQGLERISQIKHALLEAGGGISIIPTRREARRPTHLTSGQTTAPRDRHRQHQELDSGGFPGGATGV